MSKKPENKCIMGANGFAAFCNQFGDDNSIYKRVLLEVFFEELLNETNVHIPGEKGQEGVEDSDLLERGDRSSSDTPGEPKDS